MYVVIDAVGILVFISLAWLFSSDRHRIYWRPVALMVMTSLIIAWLLTSFTAGRAAVRAPRPRDSAGSSTRPSRA